MLGDGKDIVLCDQNNECPNCKYSRSLLNYRKWVGLYALPTDVLACSVPWHSQIDLGNGKLSPDLGPWDGPGVY